MSHVCMLSKIYKNEHGLKIHQAWMKWFMQGRVAQLTGSIPGETQEEPGTSRRARNHQALSSPAPNKVVQQYRIKWLPATQPKSGTNLTWMQTESSNQQQREMQQMASDGNHHHCQFCSWEVQCWRGQEHQKQLHHRPKDRQDQPTAARQFKATTEEEKLPLDVLCNIIRKKFMTLHRAEWHRRWRRKRASKQTAFIADSFEFTKQLLGQKHSGHLAFSKEEVDHFLHNTLSEPNGEKQPGPHWHSISHCGVQHQRVHL